MVGPLIVTILTPSLVLGITAIYINLTKGIVPQLGDGFKEISRWLPAFILNIAINVFVFLWSLLLVVPGIIKSFSYSMSYYILAENPDMTAKQSLNESKRIMDGHKMDYFMLMLSFIPWIILGVITCGLAFLYVIPYVSTATANFYNEIKGPAVNTSYQTY